MGAACRQAAQAGAQRPSSRVSHPLQPLPLLLLVVVTAAATLCHPRCVLVWHSATCRCCNTCPLAPCTEPWGRGGTLAEWQLVEEAAAAVVVVVVTHGAILLLHC